MIKVLETEISNMIAAGEVVERPASAVKELMENAVDAGASSIVLEVKNGGLTYIRITDNGCGMDAEDAQTAFLRHATSKISTAEDLESIATLGFRGEALSSIAAVSKITLMTKRKDFDGILVEIESGEVVKDETIGCPDGTTIVVKELFYNTPARMKFLKTDRTELSYITDIAERLALSHPEIAIKYISDGKIKLQTSGDGNILSCIYAIYGADYAKNIKNVAQEKDGLIIEGVIGTPIISRPNRGFQTFFVNGRYVKSRLLTAAVEEAFKNRVMVGKFPFFVLNLKIPYESVDVNVHPTKIEVKFSHENRVFDAVYWAVKNALEAAPIEVASVCVPSIETTAVEQFFTPKAEPVPLSTRMLDEFVRISAGEESLPEQSQQVMCEEVVPITFEIAAPVAPMMFATEADEYSIVGQAFDTYILVQQCDKLILIDQHAAHERQIYENLKKDNVNAQMLMSPANITLTKPEVALVMDSIDIFEKIGFDVSQYGDNTIAIRQTPVDLQEDELAELVAEVIEKISVGSKADRLEICNRALYTVACKAAIKANRVMNEREMRALADWVLAQTSVDTCPHGRPLTYVMTKYQVEKMFKRV